MFGTPTEQTWPGVTQLPYMQNIKFPPRPFNRVALRSIFAQEKMSDLGFDFFLSLCAMDPAKRLSAAEALNHPYFNESPKPVPAGNLMRGLHFAPPPPKKIN